MTQQEAEIKDRILKFLVANGGTKQFNGCDEISKRLQIEKHTVSTYCEEMDYDGLVKYDKHLQGCSVRIIDKGIHYFNTGGYTELVYERGKENEIVESDRVDERLSRKVTRSTARGSLAISIVALSVAVFALLAQLFGWFTNN
jgi:hypothetical protein